MCLPLRPIPRKDFVVDVSINWTTDRNWQDNVLDIWKAKQLMLLCQGSVKYVLRRVSTDGTLVSEIVIIAYCSANQYVFLEAMLVSEYTEQHDLSTVNGSQTAVHVAMASKPGAYCMKAICC